MTYLPIGQCQSTTCLSADSDVEARYRCIPTLFIKWKSVCLCFVVLFSLPFSSRLVSQGRVSTLISICPLCPLELLSTLIRTIWTISTVSVLSVQFQYFKWKEANWSIIGSLTLLTDVDRLQWWRWWEGRGGRGGRSGVFAWLSTYSAVCAIPARWMLKTQRRAAFP